MAKKIKETKKKEQKSGKTFKPVTLWCGEQSKLVLTKEHYEYEIARGRWRERE